MHYIYIISIPSNQKVKTENKDRKVGREKEREKVKGRGKRESLHAIFLMLTAANRAWKKY